MSIKFKDYDEQLMILLSDLYVFDTQIFIVCQEIY